MATRVAVSGHRVLAEPERVVQGIGQALERIEQAFGAPLLLATALAEGADRLAAHAVLRRPAAGIVAMLPRELRGYLEDFPSTDSRRELLQLLAQAREVTVSPPASSTEEGYLAAGLAALEGAAILLAVWDGLPSQGVGGVGDIVAAARERGLPMAWVHAGNRRPGTMEPTSQGADQGRVTYERFPS